MLNTRNSLPLEVRTQTADLLNEVLADLADLESQSRQAHWNVRGRLFFPLHKLFEDLAGVAGEPLDDIAERIAALGGIARGTVRMAAAGSRLPEFAGEQPDDLAFVAALRDRFALCAGHVREAIDRSAALGDAGTADLFTGVSRALDKAVWMLEAHHPG